MRLILQIIFGLMIVMPAYAWQFHGVSKKISMTSIHQPIQCDNGRVFRIEYDKAKDAKGLQAYHVVGLSRYSHKNLWHAADFACQVVHSK